jgi:hypothetical protein
MHRKFIPILVVLLGMLANAAASDIRLTVDQLVAFIKSAVKLKQPDRQVAEYLRHVKITNRLDDQTIEDLQSIGAGTKTVAMLKELGESSAKLEAPPPAPVAVAPKTAPSAPPPDSITQAQILDEVKEYALNYTKALPNFLCVQVTRRYVDPSKQDNWRLADTITSKLSFFDQHEDYKLIMMNGNSVTNQTLESIGGTNSFGDFGSLMKAIFEPETKASFEWDHWGTLRGRRAYVFSYDIEQSNSKYHIVYDRTQDYVPAYRGLIYVDLETKKVVRVTMDPYDIPPGFPIQQVREILDYDYTVIGDTKFLVPLKAVITSLAARYASKNDEEFRLYRKFGTDSSIKFETPDPLPEDKTKEKP